MYKIIRFFNKNRKQIIKIILVIVFVFGIIQLLNGLAKINNNVKNVSDVTKVNESNSTFKNELVSKKSSVGGEKVSTSKLNSDSEIIKEFIQYCNDEDLESAYGLLTDECKEEMFSTIEDFKVGYYIPVFNNTKKLYTIENWTGDIYKVKINDDVLATGEYTIKNAITEYITVKSGSEKNRLNINSYIGRTTLNKEIEYKNIAIKVIEKNVYMNYSTYVFEVTNNSEKTILINDLNNIDTMYIQDKNEVNYSAYTHEISQNELKINSFGKKQIKIKYYDKYRSTKEINKIVFSKLILDYDKYVNIQNRNEFGEYCNFEIEL